MKDGKTKLTDQLREFIERLEDQVAKQRLVSGISTGYDDLDSIINGLNPGDLTVVSGHQSLTSLAFVQNLLVNIGGGRNVPTAMIGIAQQPNKIIANLLGILGYIDTSRIQSGTLNDDEWARFSSSIELLKGFKINTLTPARMNVSELTKTLRQLKEDEPELSVCAIDKVNFMISKDSGDYTPVAYEHVMREIKQLAAELKISIILIANLEASHALARPNKRPFFTDFKPNNALHTFADNLIFLYQDSYFNYDSEDDFIEAIIDKNANGPIGTVRLFFDPLYQKFTNFEASPDGY